MKKRFEDADFQNAIAMAKMNDFERCIDYMNENDEVAPFIAILAFTMFEQPPIDQLIQLVKHSDETKMLLGATALSFLSTHKPNFNLADEDHPLLLWSMCRVGAHNSIDILVKKLQDKSSIIRSYASLLLGRQIKVIDRNIIKLLSDNLLEPSNSIESKIHIVMLLRRRKVISFINILVKMLTETDNNLLRYQCIITLNSFGEIGKYELKKILLGKNHDLSFYIATFIETSSESHIDVNYIHTLVRLFREEYQEDSEFNWMQVSMLLGLMGEYAIEPLIEMLDYPNRRVTWIYLSIAFSLIGVKAIDHLINQLRDNKDYLTRAYVAEILSDLGSEAVPYLLKRLEFEEDIWIRRGVVWALGWIRDKSSLIFLQELLNNAKKYNEDHIVIAYTQDAIRKIEETY